MSTSLQLSVDSTDVQRDLVAWLHSEGSDTWTIHQSARPPGAGEMGTEEILTVIIASGGLTALLRSLQMWIRYRQPKVHVQITRPGGERLSSTAVTLAT